MIDFRNRAVCLGNSPLFLRLADHYALVPSAVLIRTAEAELLRSAPIDPPALDLCCGDGFFASLIRPQGFEAGCDINESALLAAAERNIYGSLAYADVTREIPFPDAHFNTVVSNSSLEHVDDIHKALREITRVLRPGGRLYTTLGSNFAYEWWPCGQEALKRYLEYQPVYNHFSLEEWEECMARVGLRIVSHQYYLSKPATRLLMFLDYHYSHVSMTADRTPARPIIRTMRRVPGRARSLLWQTLFAPIKILSQGSGGGILIIAERPET